MARLPCTTAFLYLGLAASACASGQQTTESDTQSSTSSPTAASSTTTDATTEDTTAGTDDSEAGSDSGSTATDTDPSATDDSDATSDPSTSDPTTDPTTTDPTTTDDPCVDNDGDGHGEGCELGPDCDDDDYNNYDAGCETCVDSDADNFWVGCDQYDDLKPGPDCDDDNVNVGADDMIELCNGVAENCAGEVDPLPADEMCPSDGDPQHVADEGGWICNVTQVGVDGCEIALCDVPWYDANGVPGDGCECEGTARTASLAECGDGVEGYLGSIAEGETLANVIVGVLPLADNGPGQGAEDWFYVDFPEADANGARPAAGRLQISFEQNDGDPDYRFELHRACNQPAFDEGLAADQTPGNLAPLALEWTFEDTNQGSANYESNIVWPERVYIRVYRAKNGGACNSYKLSLSRAND
ncbi:MAG: hypothetical protein R3A51_09425 [Nannocystaceae bacterium]|nr:hypothetical protein [Myxococcales bacterium]